MCDRLYAYVNMSPTDAPFVAIYGDSLIYWNWLCRRESAWDR